ncbi:MAG: ATP-binding protein [Byssovorax sp.]
MIDAASEDAELERRIEERVARRKRERFAQFDPAALAWMVLVPSWTEELARACEFPANVPSLFPELCRVGLCARSKHAFWMPDAERAQTSAFLLATFPRELFDEHADRIARGLLGPARDLLTPPLARWADLASRSFEGPAHLRTQVREALHRGEAGDALGWLDSARYLEGLVSARYGVEITLSQRRIELIYRLGQDRRHLESFLARPEQNAAIERLLAPDSPCWALHLLGMGGVGKTMLLRHVTVTQADRQQAIVARVDFDHLNPDFPVRRPGQLLAALAEELSSQLDGGRQQSLLTSFHGYVAELNEQLSAEPPPDDPLGNLRHPLFSRILGAFADLLRSLPRRPLFILDTCEELAKIDPVSAMIPGVEAMLYMLELLHVLVPELRVLLAGRRLLAQGGGGWTVDLERLGRDTRRLPERRSFLALHVLRGFSASEVDAYLAAQNVTLTGDARAALLAQCPDAGGLAGLASIANPDDSPRYNPFDVALYTGWIQADPELDLARIARFDTDPYVELRILRRLESDDLRDAMPALTLLRRFDRGALALLFPGDQSRIDRLYRLLGEQEWTDYQADGSGGALEINRALSPRITAYFEHPMRRDALDAARAKLAPLLADLLRATPLQDCRIETIDAALRAAPAAEGAALWADLERRIALGSAFSWAVRVAGRLLGDGAAAAIEGPLRVAIQATHTSAITHEQSTIDLHAAWEEIDRGALKYPDDARMASLHLRAVAGQIAASRVTRKAPSREKIDELIRLFGEPEPDDEFLADQRFAAFAAAVDATLDTGAEVSIPSLVTRFRNLRRVPSSLVAFVTLLDARRSVRTAKTDRATALFDAALQIANPPHVDTELTGYLDWTPPANLADRVRLERERSVVAPERTDEDLRAQLADVTKRPWSIDAERWVAAMIFRRLARGLVPGDIVNDVLQHETYDAARVPTCEAHRATPRLLIAATHAIAAAGNPARALALLDARLDAATENGHDKPTIVAVQRAKLAVMQRYRIDPGAFATRLLDEGDPHLRFAAGSALALTGAADLTDLLTVADDSASAAPWLGLGGAPEDIAAHRQPRALAERALLAAEQLALRDAKAGAVELVQAANAFAGGGDAVGALIAAIAASLAAARARSRTAETTMVHALVAMHYPSVVALVADGVLPDHEALQSNDLLAGVALIESAPAGWQEWLFRLIVCLHRARPGRQGDTDDRVLASALEARYGAQIPAELHFTGVGRATEPVTGEPAKYQIPPTTRLENWIINGLVVVFTVGVIAAMFYFDHASDRLLLKFFLATRPVQVGVVVAVLALVVLLTSDRREKLGYVMEVLRDIFIELPRALLFRRDAAIHLDAPDKGSPLLTLRIERHTRFRGSLDGPPSVESWSAGLARPELADSRAAVSATLPAQPVAGFKAIDRGFFTRRHVPIVTPRSEAVLPWEAYLRSALSPTQIRSAVWLYRPVPASKEPSRAQSKHRAAGLKLFPGATTDWSPSFVPVWAPEPAKGSPTIVHAIGIPVRTTSGMRLQISRDKPDERLLSEQLARATFLVLQLPTVDSLERGVTDRQQVADLRELGFDTATSRTPFVLVLPALTNDDATLLITALSKKFGQKEPSLDHLLSITEDLRSLLLRPKDPHAAELSELAYDITLFAAETGPLRGGKTTP